MKTHPIDKYYARMKKSGWQIGDAHFAKMVGVSKCTIWRFRTFRHVPESKTLARIAELTQIPMRELRSTALKIKKQQIAQQVASLRSAEKGGDKER